MAQWVHRNVEALADAAWRLADARQRQRRRADEATAAEQGLTVGQLRAKNKGEKRAAKAAARAARQEQQLAAHRSEGHRQRGAPRTSAARSHTAMEAVEEAVEGRPERLLSNWIVEVPLML